MLRRFAITGLLVLTFLIIASCSLKTVYNNLDYLIPEYVDGMVSLDDVLEERVEQRTVALLSWHRNSQIPEYADWLQAVQQDIDKGGLTEQQVLYRTEQINGFWQRLVKEISREMSVLLPLLNQSQRNELFASLADANEEFREKYIEPDQKQRSQDYAERLRDNYERWLGDLTEKQLAAIETAALNLRSSAELRLQRRLKWQQGLYRILHNESPVIDTSQRIAEFISGFENTHTETMKAIIDNNRSVIAQLTVHMANSMNQEQRRHFMETTDEYIEMFGELGERRQAMLQR